MGKAPKSKKDPVARVAKILRRNVESGALPASALPAPIEPTPVPPKPSVPIVVSFLDFLFCCEGFEAISTAIARTLNAVESLGFVEFRIKRVNVRDLVDPTHRHVRGPGIRWTPCDDVKKTPQEPAVKVIADSVTKELGQTPHVFVTAPGVHNLRFVKETLEKNELKDAVFVTDFTYPAVYGQPTQAAHDANVYRALDILRGDLARFHETVTGVSFATDEVLVEYRNGFGFRMTDRVFAASAYRIRSYGSTRQLQSQTDGIYKSAAQHRSRAAKKHTKAGTHVSVYVRSTGQFISNANVYNNVKEARLEPEFTQKTSLCLQRSFFEGVPELADLLASTTSYTVGLEVEQDTQTLEWIYKGRYDLMLKKIAVEEVKDEVIEVSDDE